MEKSVSNEILIKIRSAKNILINVDTRTDLDALCGTKVLNNFINSLGIKTDCIHSNSINETFTRFNDFSHIRQNVDISSLDLSNYDLIIFFDSGSKAHISLNESFVIPENIFTINIDHHKSNELYGNINYVYKYGSCCSVLYQLLTDSGYKISKNESELLVMGLLADTGFFRFTNLTSYDLKIVSEMMGLGVDIPNLISELSNYEYFDQIKYKEIVFKNTKVNFDKKFAYTTVSLDEINEKNIDMNKVFVRHSDLLKDIEGINFAFAIAEVGKNPTDIEISFRSKNPDFDVCKLAEKFGGKGHKNAAGAKIYGEKSFNDAVDFVLSKISN